jgi:dihydropteroate synthase
MTKIVGILNVTENSFSDGGRYNKEDVAIRRVIELFDQGADIVDIGAQSTSYGAEIMPYEDEWDLLSNILENCANTNISVDTYNYQTAAKAIYKGVGMINDVSGGHSDDMLRLMADNANVKYVAMFSLVLPADKGIRVAAVEEVYSWCEYIISRCRRFGIKKDQLILDPGIGFSTNPEQSLAVIKHVGKLKKHGYPIMIGHSRKSFLEKVTDYPPAERDIETLAASIFMNMNEVDYVRVHNVDWHNRAFNVITALQ